MSEQFIILTGIPASGKSSIGKAIAEQMQLKFFDKDDLLENLFEERGIGDAEWRRALSKAADELLREQVVELSNAVVVSWWRHPNSTSSSGTSIDWLSQLPGSVVDVYCRCSPSIAAKRFVERRRHPGHLDAHKSVEVLTGEFERHAALGPLGLGTLVEVNTEESVDVAGLVESLTKLTG